MGAPAQCYIVLNSPSTQRYIGVNGHTQCCTALNSATKETMLLKLPYTNYKCYTAPNSHTQCYTTLNSHTQRYTVVNNHIVLHSSEYHTQCYAALKSHGVQEWCSDESARLLPLWPGLIPEPSVTCGLSLLLVFVPAPRVFLRVLRFSSLHKNRHSKFQYDPRI